MTASLIGIARGELEATPTRVARREALPPMLISSLRLLQVVCGLKNGNFLREFS